MSTRALQLLTQYKESNLFLRGVIMDMGLKIDKVYFDVKPRSGGESKYTLKKMCSFALNSITSFSVAPLRLVSTMGITFFCLAFLFLGYVLYAKFWANQAIVGWASTAILLCFFSGIQLLSLGIIGEYIGKIYAESKRCPRYVIEEVQTKQT
ncbi:Glycosyltransferase [Helicobacter typhlonius]|uniref:Glycosyltransferase n=1 Tax=Helicobacter typhlonius TaxID=76936 RepID=A0A0S4PSV0_9HELI|nr:Glycosyltransferase [Helicobacter typhlonius]